jgi:hypothetical protein
VFGAKQLRIIDMDGYKCDIPPTGTMLFFNNRDRPGKPLAAYRTRDRTFGCLCQCRSSLKQRPDGNISTHACAWSGILKTVAGILANNKCNIAHFSVGRQQKGDKALAAITLVRAWRVSRLFMMTSLRSGERTTQGPAKLV